MTGMEHANVVLLFVFVIANLAITGGYAYLALAVVPKVAIEMRRTQLGGIGFFLLCGATHLGMAWTALVDEHYARMATSWHMLAVHVPQAVCVWLFVTGVFIETGNYGLLRTKEQRKREEMFTGPRDDTKPGEQPPRA